MIVIGSIIQKKKIEEASRFLDFVHIDDVTKLKYIHHIFSENTQHNESTANQTQRIKGTKQTIGLQGTKTAN